MQIRQMSIKDIEAVHQLSSNIEEFKVDGKNTFWPIDMLGTWICAGEDVMLVAEEDGQLAGFFLSQLHRPSGKACIENCMVADGFRGRGVSTQLFKEGIKQLKQKGAKYICGQAHSDNDPIFHILKKFGMEKGEKFTWLGMFV